jgi:hypothetical protein
MNLENLTPDTSSKLSFYLIIIVMGIFGFIQDFIFNIHTSGVLTPIFLISFIIFSILVYLNYRYNEYRKFYMTEITTIPNPTGFYIILSILLFFIVTPNSFIKVVGIKTWMFIFTIIFIFIFIFLIAGIVKYKYLISGLIDNEIKTYKSKEDIKIKNFIIENREKLSSKELIRTLVGFNYNEQKIRIITFLLTYEFPLI